MKAVLLRRGNSGEPEARVEEMPVPEAATGELLVEMKACGLCGTDIEKLRGQYTAAMPVLGHEAVGTVTEADQDSGGFRRGDRVFPHHHVPCYSCHFCTHGSETMCADYRNTNLDPGGLSEVFRVPRANVSRGGVIRLSASVSDILATMIEPLACCIRAIGRAGAHPGDSALVVGAGPVGLTHALLLRSMHARVFITDVARPRLEFAERIDAGEAIDAAKRDAPSEVRAGTAGRGADIAIVASGSPAAAVQALKSVRRGGTVCLFGIPFEGSQLDYSLSGVYNSEITIIPSYGAVEKDTARAHDMLATGELDLKPLMTHTFPLERFHEAVRAATSGDAIKVVLTSSHGR